MDYSEIDARWQKAWKDAKLFEGDVSSKKPYMITVAFPYVNGPQHIGHLRTFGIADVLARYKRMAGFNVLFPMAFHATGTPILAFAKRIKDNDTELINDLNLNCCHWPAAGRFPAGPEWTCSQWPGSLRPVCQRRWNFAGFSAHLP